MCFFINACSPYSDEAFFEPTKTSAYQLGDYQGETGFQLDDNVYAIDSNLININRALISDDGNNTVEISGIYVGDISKINVNKVIVYCHDKMENIDYYWPRIEILAKLGLVDFGIMIVDYRGYGESQGTPSESALYADVNAALVWLEANGLTDDRLIMYGYGLGSAVAIELTANPRTLTPAKIIIESPLASIESLIQDTTLQATPGSFISNLKFNNIDKIKNITQPILWMHGAQDRVYNIDTQGQLLYDHHPGTDFIKNPDAEFFDKTAFRISNANHFNVPQNFDNGLEGYVFNVLTFVSTE